MEQHRKKTYLHHKPHCKCYLCAGFKVRMREWPRSFQKLLDMVPTVFPVTGASIVSIHHHPEDDMHV